MSRFGLPPLALGTGDLHQKTPFLHSGKLLSGEAPICSDNIFFGDMKTISSSLDKSKENEVFNVLMIENAYYTKNKNYAYTSNPIINQKDKANITALIYAPALQERINKEYNCLKGRAVMHESDYQIKGNLILTELIVKEFTAVAPSDINSGQWANENPLTSAMLACIKDSHEQPDINAIVSDRAIRFLCTKMPHEMNEIFSLDGFITPCMDEIAKYVFSPEGGKVTFPDDIAENIKRKVQKMAYEARDLPETRLAELTQLDTLIKNLS